MRETRRPTVLVAAHNADTRYLLKFWLEAEGYGVVEAADGVEAVELTVGDGPDLVLMSERMPGLDGLEAARRIRERRGQRHCHIVCMSSYPTREAQAHALGGGCCDSFVAEPLDFGDLGSLLRSVLPDKAVSRQARGAVEGG